MSGYDVRQQVIGLVAQHLKPGMWHTSPDGVGDGAFRRLARRVDLELLARLAKSDCLGRTGPFDCSAMDWFLSRARALGVEHAPPAPLLLGRHLLALGMTPGPEIGRILKAVYERQLDGQCTTLEAARCGGARAADPVGEPLTAGGFRRVRVPQTPSHPDRQSRRRVRTASPDRYSRH